MYNLRRKFCSKFRQMADKPSESDKMKRNPRNQISFTKTSLKIKDALTRFQDLNKRTNHKDTSISVKDQAVTEQLGGLLSIPDMFSQENNYFEAAAMLVSGSDTTQQSSPPIHVTVTPGESEVCLLEDTKKQLIHKLVIQALYSSNCNTNSTQDATNGHGYSVSNLIIGDVTRDFIILLLGE